MIDSIKNAIFTIFIFNLYIFNFFPIIYIDISECIIFTLEFILNIWSKAAIGLISYHISTETNTMFHIILINNKNSTLQSQYYFI